MKDNYVGLIVTSTEIVYLEYVILLKPLLVSNLKTSMTPNIFLSLPHVLAKTQIYTSEKNVIRINKWQLPGFGGPATKSMGRKISENDLAKLCRHRDIVPELQ
jgi:hypothetical protein